jgi:hypothetical protein
MNTGTVIGVRERILPMLVIKAFINNREIDTIWIHNTSETEDGEYIYELIEPGTRNRLTYTTITHKRDEGYRKLLIKALDLLEEEDIPTTT